MRGRFVTFEGIEGSGKSTQLGLLRAWMEEGGLPVLATREPGGTALGRAIRQALLTPGEGAVAPEAELLLYEADRAQHVRETVRPALERGLNVLCDRFFDSTTAYQAFGRGLDGERVRALNAWAAGGLAPDLTFLFDLPVEEGLRRARGRGPGDRLEREALEFHERVRRGFLALVEREAGRFRVIPPGTIEETHTRVVEAVKEAFGWAGRTSAAKTRP
ncbi:MAG: dTMP kinase [Candidatus Tectomicrobia bacterium]|uniref:Thymidylate kinase n=1 Tax=Tectimicrobiota bacterium TaxID=2528274 RepID=A0A932HV34_UNCTE|nr:dTMP kinase [Candidatus Tectomicrobia bacterium]